MTTHEHFVPLETVEPEAARRLRPGVHFFVSAMTFAEAAAAVDKAIQARLDDLQNRESHRPQPFAPRNDKESFPGAEV